MSCERMSTSSAQIYRVPRQNTKPRRTSFPLLALGLLAAGLINWGVSFGYINPDELSGLGLITILPPSMGIAYGCIIAGFVVTLAPSMVRTPAPAVMLVAFVLLLHLTPALAYENLRYSWAWKHVGVIEFVMRTGHLDPTSRFLAAYHNWPGFFLFFAAIGKMFHLDALQIADLARFYPTVLNLGFMAALLRLYRNFTDDIRIIWLATALFLVCNWIGQDYFSPQGTVFLFYLVVIALLTGPLALRQNDIGRSGAQMVLRRLDMLSAPVALVLIFAIIVSHQITPLFLLASLTALSIFGRINWGYVVFTLIAEVFWLFYFADAFIAPEFSSLLAEFGRLSDDTLGRIADLNQVSSDQRIVSLGSRALTGLLALGALIGVIRRLLGGHRDVTALVLTVAPAPVLLATSYGGEIAFRLYLFTAPFLAFFAAAALAPGRNRGGQIAYDATTAVVIAVMVPLFILGNNGKDAQYRFTTAEVEAADWLYSKSEPGQLLIEGARSYPSQFRNYENFIYVPLSEELPELADQLIMAPEQLLVRWLVESPAGGYIILTKSQKALFDGLGLLPAGAMEAIEQKLIASAKLKVAFANADALILTLNPAYAIGK